MKKITVLGIFSFALLLLLIFNQSDLGIEDRDIPQSTTTKNDETKVEVSGKYTYGISASDQLAAEVAQEVLESGGNAVDAAVAISYALGITEPYATGIGGGGGMMIKYKEEEPIFLDYREVSDQTGEPREDMIAVPSFVYAMDHISEKYGTLPIDELIEPSIKMAKDGIPISEEFAYQLNYYTDRISGVYPEGYDINNNPLETGDILEQDALGEILEKIVDQGPDYFYEMLQEEMKDPLQYDIADIKQLAIQEKQPVQMEINDLTFYAPPAPFSGETTLQILKAFNQKELPAVWDGHVKDLVEMFKVVRNSYAHRFNQIGDPDFIHVPDGLSDSAINYIMTNEDFETIEDDEPVSTTHFSIIDQEGNIVSATNTLGNFFGHKKNELGFFFNSNLTIASPDSEGPNKLEPYKRSRTFMSPMIFTRGEEAVALGSPGGSRIPEIIAHTTHNYLASDDFVEATDKLRISVLNDQVAFEDYVAPEISTKLEENNYGVSINTSPLYFGGVNAIGIKNNQVFGVADSRRNGTLIISE